MPSWEEVQARKVEMQKEAVSTLEKEEYEVLRRVLELEWESRHLAHSAAASEVRKTLRNFIIQEFK
jgi:hypothetical protein